MCCNLLTHCGGYNPPIFSEYNTLSLLHAAVVIETFDTFPFHYDFKVVSHTRSFSETPQRLICTAKEPKPDFSRVGTVCPDKVVSTMMTKPRQYSVTALTKINTLKHTHTHTGDLLHLSMSIPSFFGAPHTYGFP